MVRDHDIIEQNQVLWHLDFRRENRGFEHESLQGLLSLLRGHLLSREEEDELIWIEDSSGAFSIKQVVEKARLRLLFLVWPERD